MSKTTTATGTSAAASCSSSHHDHCCDDDDNISNNEHSSMKKKKRRTTHNSNEDSSLINSNTSSSTSSTSSISSNQNHLNNHHEIFTLYPDSKTGLIDKKEFLSKYEAYQVIYLPQILSHSHHQSHRCQSQCPSTSTSTSPSVEGSDTNIKSNTSTGITKSTGAIEEGFTWRDISDLFSALNQEDQSSWTEEIFNMKSYKYHSESDSDSNDKKDESNEQTRKQKLEPGAFLSPTMNENDDDKKSTIGSSSGIQQERGYSSFIVQNDKEAMEKLLNTLPLTRLPINKYETEDTSRSSNIEGDGDGEDECEEVAMIDKASNGNRNENEDQQEKSPFMKMKYGPCLWIFYGRNDAERNQHLHQHQSQPKKQPPLCGRPEHTDSISHHGTWHYQLSGIKEWHLRPTEDLMKQMQTNNLVKKEELEFWSDYDYDSDKDDDKDNVGDSSSSHQKRNITVTCREGDVLLVNTRLWWHSTTIPEQPLEIETDANKNANTNTTRSVPSVSYARDIYLSWGDNDKDDIIQEDGNMTNLDGSYASNDIEAGTIIFTEDDAPNCELHRSKDNPNCEVIELENGSSAVVSCRDIKSGEFFCLLETDDEDSNGGFESNLEEEIDEESE